jgi:hypothetical protein
MFFVKIEMKHVFIDPLNFELPSMPVLLGKYKQKHMCKISQEFAS